jgi:hypothetical protein
MVLNIDLMIANSVIQGILIVNVQCWRLYLVKPHLIFCEDAWGGVRVTKLLIIVFVVVSPLVLWF